MRQGAASVYVRHVGLASPLGMHTPAAIAALVAGLDRKRELSYVSNEGLPIIGSSVAWLGDERGRQRRWLRLLLAALRDAFCDQFRLLETGPLVCALPQERNAGGLAEPAALARQLSEGLAAKVDPRHLHIIRQDSVGGVLALAKARELLLQRHAEHAVVCAADSLVGSQTLLELERADRLLTDTNSDGLIPGEAAACLSLHRTSQEAAGALLGIGTGVEPALLDNDVPLRGDGVAAASKAALAEAGLPLHELDIRLSDAAGEGYQFKELSLALTRVMRGQRDAMPLELIAARLGHTGAAAALSGAAAFFGGCPPTEGPARAILYASNDVGARAAVVLSRPALQP